MLLVSGLWRRERHSVGRRTSRHTDRATLKGNRCLSPATFWRHFCLRWRCSFLDIFHPNAGKSFHNGTARILLCYEMSSEFETGCFSRYDDGWKARVRFTIGAKNHPPLSRVQTNHAPPYRGSPPRGISGLDTRLTITLLYTTPT
jgi:hypothetical protein